MKYYGRYLKGTTPEKYGNSRGPGGRICMSLGVAAPAGAAPLARLGISVRGAAQAISAALLSA